MNVSVLCVLRVSTSSRGCVLVKGGKRSVYLLLTQADAGFPEAFRNNPASIVAILRSRLVALAEEAKDRVPEPDLI